MESEALKIFDGFPKEEESECMDQCINAVFSQCSTLYKQLHFWQRVIVPIRLEFHAVGPDPRDPAGTNTVTTDVTASGALAYVPQHSVGINHQIPGTSRYAQQPVLVPDVISGTIPGDGDVEAWGGGGSFPAPAIHIAISAPFPFAAPLAHVGVHSSVNFQCDLDAEKDETALPIQLTGIDGQGNRSTATVHLGAPAIIDSPVISGPLGLHL